MPFLKLVPRFVCANNIAGAIILGIGGDNSDGAAGTFYEGVMTAGFSTQAADDAVQADIVAAGYGK